MASGKLSPRQKMINMMYLVLIAMLALNVSKEIMHAFSVMGESIENSNVQLQGKNESSIKGFRSILEEDPSDLNQSLYSFAVQTQELSQEAYDDIQGYRDLLREKSGTVVDEETGEEKFKKEDDIDTGSKLLVDEKKGDELKASIEDYRSQFLDIVEQAALAAGDDAASVRAQFEANLPLKILETGGHGGENKDWKTKNFYHMPVIAVDVMMAKFQSDIVSSESQILDYLISKVGADIIEFDKLTARVIAPKSYLLQGKTYEADIFLSASSSQANFEVFIGDLDMSKLELTVSNDSMPAVSSDKPLIKDIYVTDDPNDVPLLEGYVPLSEVSEESGMKGGTGKYIVQASGTGPKNVSGCVKLEKPTGEVEFYPFIQDYEVAAPGGFAVAADKMNVLYIGVPNPITIQAGDAKQGTIGASISQGSISSVAGEGKFEARVTSPGEANISVSGEVDGERKTIGSTTFRVMRIPNPVMTLGGVLYGGNAQKGQLQAMTGLVAKLEDFVFDAQFQVVSFDMIYSSKGEVFTASATGPLLTGAMKDFMGRLQAKDIVVFQEIKVKGPDGETRKLPPLSFSII